MAVAVMRLPPQGVGWQLSSSAAASSSDLLHGSTNAWVSPHAQKRIMEALRVGGSGAPSEASGTLDDRADRLGWPGISPPRVHQHDCRPAPLPAAIAAREKRLALWRWRERSSRAAACSWLWRHSCFYRLRSATLREGVTRQLREPLAARAAAAAARMHVVSVAEAVRRWRALVHASLDTHHARTVSQQADDQRRQHIAMVELARAADVEGAQRAREQSADILQLASALRRLHARCAHRAHALRRLGAPPPLVDASAHATTAAAAAAAVAAAVAPAPPPERAAASRQLLAWAMHERRRNGSAAPSDDGGSTAGSTRFSEATTIHACSGTRASRHSAIYPFAPPAATSIRTDARSANATSHRRRPQRPTPHTASGLGHSLWDGLPSREVEREMGQRGLARVERHASADPRTARLHYQTAARSALPLPSRFAPAPSSLSSRLCAHGASIPSASRLHSAHGHSLHAQQPVPTTAARSRPRLSQSELVERARAFHTGRVLHAWHASTRATTSRQSMGRVGAIAYVTTEQLRSLHALARLASRRRWLARATLASAYHRVSVALRAWRRRAARLAAVSPAVAYALSPWASACRNLRVPPLRRAVRQWRQYLQTIGPTLQLHYLATFVATRRRRDVALSMWRAYGAERAERHRRLEALRDALRRRHCRCALRHICVRSSQLARAHASVAHRLAIARRFHGRRVIRRWRRRSRAIALQLRLALFAMAGALTVGLCAWRAAYARVAWARVAAVLGRRARCCRLLMHWRRLHRAHARDRSRGGDGWPQRPTSLGQSSLDRIAPRRLPLRERQRFALASALEVDDVLLAHTPGRASLAGHAGASTAMGDDDGREAAQPPLVGTPSPCFDIASSLLLRGVAPTGLGWQDVGSGQASPEGDAIDGAESPDLLPSRACAGLLPSRACADLPPPEWLPMDELCPARTPTSPAMVGSDQASDDAPLVERVASEEEPSWLSEATEHVRLSRPESRSGGAHAEDGSDPEGYLL